jgi:hypothetical protein
MDSILLSKNEFLDTYIQSHFAADRAIGLFAEFDIPLFIYPYEVERRSDNFFWMMSQSIHDRSLFCVYAAGLVRHLFIILIFVAITSPLLWLIGWRTIVSFADDFIIFNYDAATFPASAGRLTCDFHSLLHIAFGLLIFFAFEYFHRLSV